MDGSSSHQIGSQTYTPLEDEDELKRLCQPKQHVGGHRATAETEPDESCAGSSPNPVLVSDQAT